MNKREMKITEICYKLKCLDHDIQACEDGQIKAKTLEQYRTERCELRNELRQLQGKEPLIAGGLI